MNNQILIVGGGSKFGLELVNAFLDNKWQVNLISGSEVQYRPNLNYLQVNWNKLTVADIEKYIKSLPEQKIILFNQNSSALGDKCFDTMSTIDLWKLEKNWSQSYFNSCILPFHIIHSLGINCNKNTKVGWMLSILITQHVAEQIHMADYVGNKTQNYLLMKNFSNIHPSCFFGLNPDSLYNVDNSHSITKLIEFLETTRNDSINGKVFKLNGQEDLTFDKFYI